MKIMWEWQMVKSSSALAKPSSFSNSLKRLLKLYKITYLKFIHSFILEKLFVEIGWIITFTKKRSLDKLLQKAFYVESMKESSPGRWR